MTQLEEKYRSLFQGIGKSLLYHSGVQLVTQKLRLIPLNLMEKFKENLLGTFLGEGAIKHRTGWLHNIAILMKKWDQSKIRIALDKRHLTRHR